MQQFIYDQAKQDADQFIAGKIAAGGTSASLYKGWTTHISSIDGVLGAFQARLTQLGVGGGHAQLEYIKKFKGENGIDDNYYE